MNLVEGAAAMIAITALYEKGVRDALEEACVIIEDEAKRVLGTYEYGWPPLSPYTIDGKVTGDSPGYETGEMRDSIQHTVILVDKGRYNASGNVGTNEDKAVWFELGTISQPARSVLGEAAARESAHVAHKIGQTIYTKMIS